MKRAFVFSGQEVFNILFNHINDEGKLKDIVPDEPHTFYMPKESWGMSFTREEITMWFDDTKIKFGPPGVNATYFCENSK